MAGQATRTAPQTHEVPNWQLVSVPEQTRTRVGDAFETASLRSVTLADFASTTMNESELQKAKGNYPISVDSQTLPREAGWYSVDRNQDHNTITFVLISGTDAEVLRKNGRMYDIMYISNSAVEAAIQGRPVLLDVYCINRYGRFINVIGWPDAVARVAQLGPSLLQAQAGSETTVHSEVAKLLRVEEGQETIVIRHPDGGRSIIAVQKGSTVHIE